jgi:hypothetical protein
MIRAQVRHTEETVEDREAIKQVHEREEEEPILMNHVEGVQVWGRLKLRQIRYSPNEALEQQIEHVHDNDHDNPDDNCLLFPREASEVIQTHVPRALLNLHIDEEAEEVPEKHQHEDVHEEGQQLEGLEGVVELGFF